MRVLLSTIGTRGDVQPLVALALGLRALGHGVRLCTPPDFQAWLEGLGFEVTPIGPRLQPLVSVVRPTGSELPSPEVRQRLAAQTLETQFSVLPAAAQGCDLILGATALQVAAPSVAEHLGIPYVFVAYCPAVLPSPAHAPLLRGSGTLQSADHAQRWREDAARWNETWGAALNAERAKLGLAKLEDVRDHVLTNRPWLASDPALAPWTGDSSVVQTGAWLLEDTRALPAELERFLEAGEPPVYFGFGSMGATPDAAATMLAAARALGRRAVISKGWAELRPADDANDWISVDDANHALLFQRVAAVVHHGGAGTTTAAAVAGVPQVVVPQVYDQPYWAGRIERLGIGVAHPQGTLSAQSLTVALETALSTEVTRRARALSEAMRLDGAEVAARLIVHQALETTVSPL